MPTETALVTAAVLIAFSVFAIVLAWVNHTTGGGSAPSGRQNISSS
jgi:hypothetical protein